MSFCCQHIACHWFILLLLMQEDGIFKQMPQVQWGILARYTNPAGIVPALRTHSMSFLPFSFKLPVPRMREKLHRQPCHNGTKPSGSWFAGKRAISWWFCGCCFQPLIHCFSPSGCSIQNADVLSWDINTHQTRFLLPWHYKHASGCCAHSTVTFMKQEVW